MFQCVSSIGNISPYFLLPLMSKMHNVASIDHNPARPLQLLQHILQSPEKYVGVTDLEDQGRPEPDGRLPTAARVHPLLLELAEDAVPPRAGVAVHGAEGAEAAGRVEVARIPRLEVGQPGQEGVAGRPGGGEKVVL